MSERARFVADRFMGGLSGASKVLDFLEGLEGPTEEERYEGEPGPRTRDGLCAGRDASRTFCVREDGHDGPCVFR